ncbi:uncharacterized protein A1O9_08890 [Exophiala aquamarina CBS 119918]|uniref:Signal recognition particle subunit SRP68 n=1 Tax=Exophiala aquamarina CBS 119918 TaxID=1182545 RepID=A0A072P5X3_9EURO|nr:uncharacterized protein A1O9_08890 [Exophiala aquamarina CBS 119918]KEF55236.1 hypothetical protein A1O9_08890 [Exophiala aquamarina CBS 119918]
MNITHSIVSERDRALLAGDYSSYHSQATRRIHSLRRRLGASNRGRKYNPKGPVTPENVVRNAEWIQLLLASAERAWADAMAMKSAQSQESTQKPMPASTKRQIASRLKRAVQYAQNLVDVLNHESAGSIAQSQDTLEAIAYLSMLKGTLDFEKARWQSCIHNYSLPHIIYTALSKAAKSEAYKDLLSGIVDPSIRYAAYQLQVARTKPIDEIAIESFPESQATLRKDIQALDPLAFQSATNAAPTKDGPQNIPTTISWRTRTVKLEHANISQALGQSKDCEHHLLAKYAGFQKGDCSAQDFATSYEDVITANQDAADATKTAIDELTAEGVDPGDSRIQSLQITRTAVNYAVIEWRIGRNRILTGSHDGLDFEPEQPKRPSKPRKDGKPQNIREESAGRILSRLRERVALYDLILQSLDAVKELPGVIADAVFLEELQAKQAYFRALKCLAVGRSQAVNGKIPNALALYTRAFDLAQTASATLSSQSSSSSDSVSPPRLDLSPEQLQATVDTLGQLVTQYRALADLKALTSSTKANTQLETNTIKPSPLIERLNRNEYIENVDLSNLVNYPPKLRPVPVKPLFFDLAWNYIEYPGQKREEFTGRVQDSEPVRKQPATSGRTEETEEQKPAKRGWFGFGR